MPRRPLTAEEIDHAGLADLVLAAASRLRASSFAALEPYDLSPHPARALLVIADNEGLRPSDLAEHLRIATRSATDVIDTLEDRGLVSRSPSPTDRRAVVLAPTPTGRELAESVRQARRDNADLLAATLAPWERDTLESLLRKALHGAEPTVCGSLRG